uniref:Zinc finger (CCCH type) motif-containing protein n=1 Tax=Steinernema glaseri TaxID=37863 RepID=A0A1I7YK16_9BILA
MRADCAFLRIPSWHKARQQNRSESSSSESPAALAGSAYKRRTPAVEVCCRRELTERSAKSGTLNSRMVNFSHTQPLPVGKHTFMQEILNAPSCRDTSAHSQTISSLFPTPTSGHNIKRRFLDRGVLPICNSFRCSVMADTRETESAAKTVLCNRWSSSGHCPYGRSCKFAHGEEERRQIPKARDALYRTVLCRYYLENNGQCIYGDRCLFAHGPENLRQPDIGARNRPIPDRICHAFLFKGICAYGTACRYYHKCFWDILPSSPNVRSTFPSILDVRKIVQDLAAEGTI